MYYLLRSNNGNLCLNKLLPTTKPSAVGGFVINGGAVNRNGIKFTKFLFHHS